jgi:hypothetical protein
MPEEVWEKITEENFENDDIAGVPQVFEYFVSNLAKLVLARLWAWYPGGQQWKRLVCDETGRLIIATAVVPKSTANVTQVEVGTSVVLIINENPQREVLTILNNGTETVYIGVSSTVSTTNGFALLRGAGITLEGYVGPIYGISPTGTNNVCIWEM